MYCYELTSLNLSHFNTSNVINMKDMFNRCKSLTSLNLKNFDTSNVTEMDAMFYDCKNLTSLNVENFNTTKVVSMSSMFMWCSSLTSLNLSSFNTSKVTNMKNVFIRCSSLTSLNLNNFVTSSVTEMNEMFNGCSSLIYLNIINFDTSNLSQGSYNNIFSNVNNLFFFCINETKDIYGIRKELPAGHNNCSNFNYTLNETNYYEICPYYYYFDSSNHFHCTENKECPENYKLIVDQKKCINKCNEDDTYKFEYENKCYQFCPNGTYYYYNLPKCIDNIPEGFYCNDTFLKTIDKCDNKCSNCSLESMENRLCISCNINNNFYPKNNPLQKKFIDCVNKSKKFDGYFLN